MSRQSSVTASIHDRNRPISSTSALSSSSYQSADDCHHAPPAQVHRFETPVPEDLSSRSSITFGTVQRDRLREERDNQERIDMLDVYDNGSLLHLQHFAGGDPRDVDRYTDVFQCPPIRHNFGRQTSVSSASTLFIAPGQTPTQSTHGDHIRASSEAQQHTYSTASRDTTPGPIVQGRDAAVYYEEEDMDAASRQLRLELGIEAERQAALAALQEPSPAEQREMTRQRVAEQRRRANRALRQYNAVVEELDQVRDSLKGCNDRLNATLQAWFESIADEGQRELAITHARNCELAFPNSIYQMLNGLLWAEGVPHTVEAAIQEAIELEKLDDKLSYQSEEPLAVAQMNNGFKPEERETWPETALGEFGQEFDPDSDDDHVCEEESFCDFNRLEDLDLEPSCQAQQQYLMAGLEVRLVRLVQARRILEEQQDSTPGCHAQIFAATHCWLQVALDYVHERAHHPQKNIKGAFEATGKHFTIGDLNQWRLFETQFRAALCGVLSASKKVEWSQLVSRRDWNPLTGKTCDGLGPFQPTLYLGPDWLRHGEDALDRQQASVVDSGVMVPATPQRSPQELQNRSVRSRARRSVSRVPESPVPPSAASSRHTDADGDEDMDGEESEKEQDNEQEEEAFVPRVKQPLRRRIDFRAIQTLPDVEEGEEDDDVEIEDEELMDEVFEDSDNGEDGGMDDEEEAIVPAYALGFATERENVH